MSMDLDQVEVDLHILVVPDSQWRPDLHLAYINACMSSVSAGFVRVDACISLDELRGELSRQLDSTLLPSSYIFLRSVGISMHNQQKSGALFDNQALCSTTACPEIYLLNASVNNDALKPLFSSPVVHHPGSHPSPQHYTPHAIASHPTSGQRHGVLLDPAIDDHYHVTSTRSSFLQLSDKSKKLVGSVRKTEDDNDDDHTSLVAAPDVLGEQNQVIARQYYQPSNNEGDYRGHPHNKSVSGRNVHFESLSHLNEEHSLSSTDTDLESSDKTVHTSQSILFQIRKVREESKHLGMLKESLSSTVRQLQHKLQHRKERDNSEWNKKLVEEKKRTKTLEKSIHKVKAELEAVDQAKMTKKNSVKKSSVRDERQKNTKSAVVRSESNHTNLKLECKRADKDMNVLRTTLEEEKQKFKMEQERHHSIVEECKLLKKELNQLKIAHNKRV